VVVKDIGSLCAKIVQVRDIDTIQDLVGQLHGVGGKLDKSSFEHITKLCIRQRMGDRLLEYMNEMNHDGRLVEMPVEAYELVFDELSISESLADAKRLSQIWSWMTNAGVAPSAVVFRKALKLLAADTSYGIEYRSHLADEFLRDTLAGPTRIQLTYDDMTLMTDIKKPRD